MELEGSELGEERPVQSLQPAISGADEERMVDVDSGESANEANVDQSDVESNDEDSVSETRPSNGSDSHEERDINHDLNTFLETRSDEREFGDSSLMNSRLTKGRESPIPDPTRIPTQVPPVPHTRTLAQRQPVTPPRPNLKKPPKVPIVVFTSETQCSVPIAGMERNSDRYPDRYPDRGADPAPIRNTSGVVVLSSRVEAPKLVRRHSGPCAIQRSTSFPEQSTTTNSIGRETLPQHIAGGKDHPHQKRSLSPDPARIRNSSSLTSSAAAVAAGAAAPAPVIQPRSSSRNSRSSSNLYKLINPSEVSTADVRGNLPLSNQSSPVGSPRQHIHGSDLPSIQNFMRAKRYNFFKLQDDSPSSIQSGRGVSSNKGLRGRRGAPSRRNHATRAIAALDFLLNIPLHSEILVSGGPGRSVSNDSPRSSEQLDDTHRRSRSRGRSRRRGGGEGHAPNYGDDNAVCNENPGGVGHPDSSSVFFEGVLAGRRLQGQESVDVNIPQLFRYRLGTRYPLESAVVRRWENATLLKGLADSRMFFSCGKSYPLVVSSVIKYDGSGPSKRKNRVVSVEEESENRYDWRGKSYYRLLHSVWSACSVDRDLREEHPEALHYNAMALDDPEFRQGRHRHVLQGDRVIGPLVSSTLLFVKPHDLKDELNRQFRETHTELDPSLTLSKIRNLKQEALLVFRRCGLELATAALACVYFEKLVVQGNVCKTNRKIKMAACILLAFKFNEPMNSAPYLKRVLQEIDRVLSIPALEVLKYEFQVFAQLEFSLHVPLAHVLPHFTRILKQLETNPRTHLGEEMYLLIYTKLFLQEQQDQDELFERINRSRNSSIGSSSSSSGSGKSIELEKEEEKDGDVFSWKNVSLSQWWKQFRQ